MKRKTVLFKTCLPAEHIRMRERQYKELQEKRRQRKNESLTDWKKRLLEHLNSGKN